MQTEQHLVFVLSLLDCSIGDTLSWNKMPTLLSVTAMYTPLSFDN